MAKKDAFNLILLVAIIYFIGQASLGHSAAGSGYRRTTTGRNVMQESQSKAQDYYKQGEKAAKNREYQKAYNLFLQADDWDSENPDILNMLAFTQRKMGRIDEALKNYTKALQHDKEVSPSLC